MKKTITTPRSDATAMVEAAWQTVGDSFERFCLTAGIATLASMMEDDTERLCGPRHGRSEQRSGHRWGRTIGRLDFHGGTIPVERPRVRGHGGEIPLSSWEAARSEDWLGRWAMNLMLINVSTRKFGRAVRLPGGDVPAGPGDSRSKSAVSRRFVELSAARMAEWMSSDLSQLDLLAIQLGFLPRMQIWHTTSHTIGQIYVPVVNWLLAIATLGAVIGFGTSDALAGAYGIAVSLLMAITTLLAALVALQWGYHPIVVIPVNGFFFIIDCIFFAANSTKLLEGGWFPLVLAGAVAFVMLTWRSGAVVEGARRNLRQPEEDLIETATSGCQARLPGTAVFLASAANGVPLALTQFIRHNHVMHERILLLTVVIEERPRVTDERRVDVIEVIKGITRVILHFGFMENNITIATGLQAACDQGKLCGIDPAHITYYVGRETIIPSDEIVGMAVWRETLFAFLQHNAKGSATFFGVPARQVVEFGTEIEI